VVLLRLDEHIAENGHRGLGAHDVENLGESVAEVIAVDLEFHWMAGGLSGFGEVNKV
jgi:hypothetical protein